ncbi:MAG: autotransporter outer membrane beta-barrel domain-containing protein [Opitutaceae bacterium]|jgi:outer membrane autotransporter protein|nr:autotransporter outer membrane beta-barrel domain-containing protein [Opitutaceae bacterium]
MKSRSPRIIFSSLLVGIAARLASAIAAPLPPSGSTLAGNLTVDEHTALSPWAASLHYALGVADGATLAFETPSSGSVFNLHYESTLSLAPVSPDGTGKIIFANNTSGQGGGAILSYGQLTLDNVEFTGNEASGGGALMINSLYLSGNGNHILSRVAFIGNIASGAIDNLALGNGGAILNTNSYNGNTLVIRDSLFQGNKAISGDTVDGEGHPPGAIGGAIHNFGGNIALHNAAFLGNAALLSDVAKAGSLPGAYAEGGAINNNTESTLALTGVNTFESNIADGYGGAVMNANGSTFRQTDATGSITFTGNQAVEGDGGAIYNAGNHATGLSTVDLTNATFRDNTAGGNSGAIQNSRANALLRINHGLFDGNAAGNSGGAIENFLGTVELTDVAFTGNTARNYGGAINNWRGSVSITVTAGEHLVSAGNSAAAGRGGFMNLYTASGDATAASAVFDIAAGASYTIGQAGAADLSPDSLSSSGDTEDAARRATLTKTGSGTLVLNADNSHYTGVFNIEAGIVAIHDAANIGSGLGKVNFTGDAAADSRIRITDNVTFDSAGADQHRLVINANKSGGFLIDDGKTLTLTNASYSDNGGAVQVASGAIFTIAPTNAGGTGAVVFTGNSASIGGAIDISGVGTVILANAIFAGNRADDLGGAIQMDDFSSLTLTRATFSGNQAGNYGGAIQNSDGSVMLRDTLFMGNSAGNSGGAIDNFHGDVILSVTAGQQLVSAGNFAGGSTPESANASRGGFLYLDNATTTFDIADGATLTLGRAPTDTGYNAAHDSIASEDSNATLTKTGPGTLALNADNSHYTGAFNIESGVVDLGTPASAPGGAIANAGTILLPQTGATFASLSGDGGRVSFKNLGETLTLGTLSGSQTFSNVEVNLTTGESDRIVVTGTATGSHTLELVDASSGAVTVDSTITGLVTVGAGSTATFDGTLDSGLLRFTLDTNGNLVGSGSTPGPTPGPAGSVILNSIGAMSTGWFQQLDSLGKRLGELRLGGGESAGQGDYWFRSYGSQTNADLGGGLDPFCEYQYGADVGVDWRFAPADGHTLVAGLFTGYQRGDRSFRDGRGSEGSTDDIYGGVYATWLHRDGWYADAVAKGQSFSSDYKARHTDGSTTSGDFDTWGAGLSLELGRQIALRDGWFVEPAVQAAWLHVAGQNYTALNAVRVSTTDADIYQFSATVRAGKTIALSGGRLLQPYARLGVSESISDGGSVKAQGAKWRPNTDGTRGIAGVGLIWQLGVLDQIHFDYEANWGDKFDHPWLVNLGYRRRW